MFVNNKYGKIIGVLSAVVLSTMLYNCKNTHKNEKESITVYEETPVSGRLMIPVDESIFPLVEDVVTVFEKEYNRIKIDLQSKSERDIVNLLLSDSLRVAVMTREMNDEEKKHYEGAVVPKITHFATDAIVFVTSKASQDSIVDYTKLLNQIEKNELNNSESFLVFDNYNSSVVTDFKRLTGFDSFPKDYTYFLKNTKEVVDYVASNPKAIGVIGLNWLTQPDTSMANSINNVKVLAVKNLKDNKYYKPSQNNIAEQTYPLIRQLYVWDTSAKNGLGVGLASYLAGYKGQRIVLKSGLYPFKTPPREIVVSNKIND